MVTEPVRHRRWIVLGAAAVLAAGCGGGGGGGGGNPPPPPPPVNPPGAAVLSLDIGLKQLQFSWTAANGATSYRLLVNPDGASGFTQVGADLAGNETSVALDVSVHLHNWDAARYMLDACNAGGCTASNEVGTVNGALEAIGYVKTSNAGAGDTAAAVALSADGETLVVGAPGEDSAATGIDGDPADNSVASAGAVYVFRRVGGAWTQQAYLKASNTDVAGNNTFDLFGGVVALSADGATLAVGAFGEDSGATGVGDDGSDNAAEDAGAVYVFVRDTAGSWSQQAYVKASNTEADDNFGFDLALSADGATLAVGAPGEDSSATGIDGDEDDNGALNSGAVYVYRRDAALVWTQAAYVKASNTDAGDSFGRSVALDGGGTTLAVGAPAEDSAAVGVGGDSADDSTASAGAAYVYAREESGDIWQFIEYVKAPSSGMNDQFHHVALDSDGDTLVVTAPLEDSSATGVDGEDDDDGAFDAGAAYVYGRSGTTWSFLAYLKASNTAAGDNFGGNAALSADGQVIAIGAGGEDGGSSGVGGEEADDSVMDAGAVYVFVHDSGSGEWSQHRYVKSSNPGAFDVLGNALPGSALALSADGGTLAAGAPSEDSAATGIGGNQNDNSASFAGAVYLY